MKDVSFSLTTAPAIPPHRRVRAGVFGVALALHLLLIAVLGFERPRRVTAGAGEASQVGIAAYIPGPVGTSGASSSPAAQPRAPKKPAATRATAAAQPSEEQAAGSDTAAAAAGQAGAGSAGGPVRLGSGGNLTLLKKVTPVYPRLLEAARMPGSVVLDAVIHRDGTIGDITILKATRPEFAQTAMEAVRQWRYTPLPYEGIVTVTVNFTPQ